MFTRLKYGLFYPFNVAELKNDKKKYTIIFFFLLVLLSMIPSFLMINKIKTLSYEAKRQIRSIFRDIDIPYEIIDYQLVKTSNNNDEELKVEISSVFHIVFNDTIETPPNLMTDKIFILFTKERVYFVQLFYSKELLAYNEYNELESLDLALATKDNSEFWNIVFPIVNQQLEKMYYSNLFMQLVLYGLLPYAIELIIFSLILAFFQKRFSESKSDIKFAQLWQLMIYILFPYVLLRLFSNLYNLYILSFIGIIITIIYSIKLNNGLTARREV